MTDPRSQTFKLLFKYYLNVKYILFEKMLSLVSKYNLQDDLA
jgi:hypothetical protein